MFLFGLQHWISPHSQPVAELVLGKIRLRVVSSGAPKTLANHSFPTGSISPQVFYICCLDWLYLLSVQQRRYCFLPCRSLQISFLPGRRHSSCVSPQVFAFLFVNITRSCISRMILSAVCISNLLQTIFLQVVQFLFTAFGICLLSSKGFPVVSIFFAIEVPQGCRDVLLNSLKMIADLHLLGRWG